MATVVTNPKSEGRSHGGFLGRFALGALAVLAVVGVAFGMLLSQTAKRGELEQSASVARVLSDALLSDTLGSDRVDDGLDAATIARLDQRLARAAGRASITGARLINTDGRVVYASDHGEIGTSVKRTAAITAGLRGTSVAELVDGGSAGDGSAATGPVVRAFVPLTVRGTDQPVGVAELGMPAQLVSSRISSQQRRQLVILAVGLVALYGLLLPIVWAAARRLRRDSDHHEFMASHDALTGLPNRVQLSGATDVLFAADQSGAPQGGVLMLLDLDGFKDVNDSLGHSAGDDLLIDVAERLSASAPTGSTIARLGGDEFAVVLPGAISAQRARAAARRMLVAFDSPFEVRGMSVAIDASVGIAIAGLHGSTRDELLQRADIAMYAAKRGKRRITVYSDDLDPMGADVLAVVSDLRRAMEANELRLHYQPKVNIGSRSVSSVEALVRWHHPERGMLMPGAFIPFAERSGLIGKLTVWAINEAVRQCRAWADAGYFLTVAINMSQSTLLDPTISAALVSATKRYGVPASAMEVEVTESALTADLESAAQALMALHEHGVRISIDDYGTGYSSIAHLRALPVQCIKIDRSYVAGMLEDPASTSIVRSTLDLAHELGLEVVAEGVETSVEYEALAEIGCDVAQGFYCARPMTADALVNWLAGLTGRTGTDAVEPPSLLPDFTLS